MKYNKMNRANYVIDNSHVYLGLRSIDKPLIHSRKSFAGCIEEINVITGEKTIICPSVRHEQSHRFISNNGYVSM
jgi:hypothetical protein